MNKMRQQLFGLKLITWTMIIAMFAIPLISHLEGKDSDISVVFPILMMGCTMGLLYPVIESLNNRLDKIERNQNPEEHNDQAPPDKS